MDENDAIDLEEKRIEALKHYDILDTLPEQEYDDIVQLASQICHTPIALISLIDEKRQWFKSSIGLDAPETPRDISFCTHAIQSDSIFEVTNPLEDKRFVTNPLVTGHPHIRFYAGAPLIDKNGYRIGTLCVINSVAHSISEDQKTSLRILARSVISLLELRKEKKEAELFRMALNEVAAVAVFGADLQFEDVNEKFLDLAQLAKSDIIGKSNTEINLADVTADESSKIFEAIADRRIYKGKIKNQNWKGDFTWSNLTVIPVVNRSNKLVKIVTLRIDTTTEELMLERLQEAEAISRVGNWELNILNNARYWSRGMYTIMEMAYNPLPGEVPSLLDLVTAEDKIKILHSFKEMSDSNEVARSIDTRVTTLTGKEKELHIEIKKRLNSKGELQSVYGTMQDITDRKAVERAMNENYLRIQDLYNNAPCGYHSLDANGYFTEVNDTELNWLGYTRDEMIGKLSLKDLLPPAAANSFDEHFAQLKKVGYLKDRQNRFIRKDGTTFDSLVNATAVYDEHGTFLNSRDTIYDITELRKVQHKLEENEAKYRSLVEESSQMSYTTDAEGSVTFVSARLRKILGHSDEFIMGTRFPFIYDDEWRKKTIIFYVQQLADQVQETTYLFPIKNSNGDKIWVEQNAILIKDRGKVTGFRCVLHDVTERVISEERMAEATRLATEARDMQQNFLGKMSHEIRTPMNGVIGMVNLLASSSLSDMQQEYVKGIKDSGENMLRIINDILDVTKIQAGKMTFEDAEFDLAHLVNNVVFSLKPVADDKDLLIAQQVDKRIPKILVADSLRLNQVLLNLAGNALKFTDYGSVIISAALKQQTEQNIVVEFKITDTGIGIAKEKLDTIFDSFTQAESDTTRKYGGTGLGLTIVKQLVEQQGGNIKVTSKLGSGTTFSFTFNCKPASIAAANDKNAGTGEQIRMMKGIHILLVEDNLMNQKVARFTLESWHAQVTIADRGKKAIELLKSNKYDLVLMDIQMPEMNGMQTTELIRNELHNATPIVAMTASAMRGEKEKCIASGMNDYISKPFVPHELNQKIWSWLPANIDVAAEKIIDMTHLKQLVNNEMSLIKEILEIYIAKTPAILSDITKYIALKDYESLYIELHNLKNSVGLFGTGKLYDLLTDIEAGLFTRLPGAKTIAMLGLMKVSVNRSIDEAKEELKKL